MPIPGQLSITSQFTKIKCNYCGAHIKEGEERCPECGGINRNTAFTTTSKNN